MIQPALAIALFGASGKMGQRLTALIALNPSYLLTPLESAEVIIDFSHASATAQHLERAIFLNKPLVLGTTGHTVEQLEEIKRASTAIPIFFSPNFAAGVSACLEAAAFMARTLAPECQISIVETHHLHKKDSPSGTALRFAQRCGTDQIESIREGEVVGEHKIIFTTAYETIELVHRAHSRDAFALGALKAAAFLRDKPPGLYEQYALDTHHAFQ